MFRRCAKCFASFISVNSPYGTTPYVKLPVMGLCPHFSVEKTEAHRGCDLPAGTFQHTECLIQRQLFSLFGLWDTTLCGFQVSSVAASPQSRVWLLLCLLLSTCSHVPQPPPSYLHRSPRSSHLISWQLAPSTPGWGCSSNCLLNAMHNCLMISQT